MGNKFLKEQDITDYELDGDSTIYLMQLNDGNRPNVQKLQLGKHR